LYGILKREPIGVALLEGTDWIEAAKELRKGLTEIRDVFSQKS
jgi:hypothetical protein